MMRPKRISRDSVILHYFFSTAAELATSKDFSKWGRVNHALSRRLTLLGEVGRLATSLGVPGE